MAQAAQSHILVQTARGLGIVTDHDFRNLVGTGDVPLDAPIARLACVPAITIEEHATAATALLRMVEHGVHHLVVTADTAPVGVVRAVDLAQFEVRQPLLLRSTIDSAANLAALADGCRFIPTALAGLRDNAIPTRHVGARHAALVDAALRRVLAIRADPARVKIFEAGVSGIH